MFLGIVGTSLLKLAVTAIIFFSENVKSLSILKETRVFSSSKKMCSNENMRIKLIKHFVRK